MASAVCLALIFVNLARFICWTGRTVYNLSQSSLLAFSSLPGPAFDQVRYRHRHPRL